MDIRRLESLQRRWTREIEGVGQLVYGERLKSVGLYSLKGRLLRMDLIKVWKSFNAVVDVGLSSLFQRATYSGTRGHELKLVVPMCSTEMRRRFMAVRVVGKWNSLPERVVLKTSLHSFKTALDVFWGTSFSIFVRVLGTPIQS